MKKVSMMSAFAAAGMMIATPAFAEEPEPAVSLSVGADVVSSYIWRGQELGGFSVQPSATITFNKANISLGAWASAELFEKGGAVNVMEFDWTLSWSPIEPLTIALTDYYLSSNSYFGDWNFSARASHNLEAQLGYDFGPVALSWNTCLTGFDHRVSNNELKRNYSTYFEVSAPFKLGGVDCSAAVGARLWDDAFTAQDGNDKFNVCNISLTANKEVFHLPLMGQIVFNPQTDNAYFVVGLSF